MQQKHDETVKCVSIKHDFSIIFSQFLGIAYLITNRLFLITDIILYARCFFSTLFVKILRIYQS